MTELTSTAAGTDDAVVVENFLKALQNQDFETVERLLADDVVYQNVGLPTVRGSRRVVSMMRGMEGRASFEVVFHRNVSDGTSVLNERTDAISVGPLRIQFWVCGVFEVRDGRITLWRDYFDFVDILKATVRGLLGVVVPALRPSM
jgi:limonene-1,2-epoxide hydrolase